MRSGLALLLVGSLGAILTASAFADAPTGVDDSYSTPTNTILTVAAPGVLGNDSHPSAGTVTAQLLSNPACGSLSLAADGSFTYTPGNGCLAGTTFTYRACHGADCSASATATITVSNNTPTTNDDGPYSVPANSVLNVPAPGVLGNDTDPQLPGQTQQPFFTELQSNPACGTLTLNPDGSFTYTPGNGCVGDRSFTYKACDGAICGNTATVTITVSNNTPTTADDGPYTVPANGTLTVPAPGVLGNDSDPQLSGQTQQPFFTELQSNPACGTLALAADGSFTYTPGNGCVGDRSFTYKACDGAICGNTATVTITVSNNTPTTTDDGPYSMPTNSVLTVPAPGVLANDSDPQLPGQTQQPFFTELRTNPACGTLTLNPDGSFTYNPGNGCVGNNTFAYRACDGAICGNDATATITVSNNTPTTNSDSYSTPTDTVLNVPAPGVLANDTDPQLPGQTQQPFFTELRTNPACGTLTLNPDGSFTYNPAGCTGTQSFTYRACDGAICGSDATVTITIGGPTAVGLRSITAQRSTRGVMLRWRTASQAILLGFNLYREVNGRRARLNRSLIGATRSGLYSFLDRRAPRQKAVRYWLEVVDLGGSRSLRGPIRIR